MTSVNAFFQNRIQKLKAALGWEKVHSPSMIITLPKIRLPHRTFFILSRRLPEDFEEAITK
jgi:hypothetical protein